MLSTIEEYIQIITNIADGSSEPTNEDARSLHKHLTKSLPDQQDRDHANVKTLWRAFFIVAYQPTNNIAQRQDRLVMLLSKIKSRDEQSSRDLPGLDAATEEMWQSAPPMLSTEQWTSFHAFIARITAADVADLSLYAIWGFRDALEIERPLNERDAESGDQPPHHQENAPVSELVPGALQWLEYCGPKVVALTVRSHVYPKIADGTDPASLGKLCEDTGVAKGGFSIGRWRFWELRLEAIAQAKDDAGGREKIAKLAYQGLEKMRSMDSEVRAMADDMGRLHGSAHRDREDCS